MIALEPEHLRLVRAILQRHVPDHEVRAFGSRVSGRPKPWSDLDIAIVADAALTISALAVLKDDLRESDLPMRVDVVEWRDLPDSIRSSPYEVLSPRCGETHGPPVDHSLRAHSPANEPVDEVVGEGTAITMPGTLDRSRPAAR
jgi:predicted nucleotidyltransferase